MSIAPVNAPVDFAGDICKVRIALQSKPTDGSEALAKMQARAESAEAREPGQLSVGERLNNDRMMRASTELLLKLSAQLDEQRLLLEEIFRIVKPGSALESVRSRFDLNTMPVRELGLSVRARNALNRLGVKTVGQLAGCTETDFISVPAVGEGTLNEVKFKLEALGLGFTPHQ